MIPCRRCRPDRREGRSARAADRRRRRFAGARGGCPLAWKLSCAGRRCLAFPRPAVLALLLAAGPAGAAQFDLGEGRLQVTGFVAYGIALRTSKQNCEFIPAPNGAAVGIAGCSIAPYIGKNQDDGNLNFSRGDLVANVLKGHLDLDWRGPGWGAQLSGQGWYDRALADMTHPWGNSPNGLAPDARLSDAGTNPRGRYYGFASDLANVYGWAEVAGAPLEWKLGYQKIDWGNRYVVLGGLRDLSPLDVAAAARPGALRFEETRIAFPAASGRIELSPQLRVEGFYQLRFQRNVPTGCGSFYSAADTLADGCDKGMLGAGSDRESLAQGQYVKRVATPRVANAGQGAIALKLNHEPWATEFGLYAANFHSRSSFFSGYNSLRAGAPYIPGDPGGLNPTYFTEYPENIRMFAASFESRWGGGAAYGEFSWRPNQPMQYNLADLALAATSLTAPSPLRAQVDALPPGGVFHGWERHRLLQLELGALQNFPGALGAANLNVSGEVVYKRVPDLPDLAVTRFGRPDVFGQGPVGGVCPPPQAPVQCTIAGYVTPNAWGYRLRATLRYPGALPGIDFVPSLSFAHDVAGWSADGAISAGRMLAAASLRALFGEGWSADLAWVPTWGGTYNNGSDRSVAQFTLGYRF